MGGMRCSELRRRSYCWRLIGEGEPPEEPDEPDGELALLSSSADSDPSRLRSSSPKRELSSGDDFASSREISPSRLISRRAVPGGTAPPPRLEPVPSGCVGLDAPGRCLSGWFDMPCAETASGNAAASAIAINGALMKKLLSSGGARTGFGHGRWVRKPRAIPLFLRDSAACKNALRGRVVGRRRRQGVHGG